jgi:hypothetical protein
MAPPLPDDLREFLRLLGAHRVEYLLIGGWAVAYHGFTRTTAGRDVWIRMTTRNAARLVSALKEFGFNVPELNEGLFPKPDAIVRLGRPPLRIEILTSISGVKFALLSPPQPDHCRRSDNTRHRPGRPQTKQTRCGPPQGHRRLATPALTPERLVPCSS